MLVTSVINILKGVFNLFLLVLIPFSLISDGFNLVGLTGFLDAALGIISRVTIFFVYVFGNPMYYFFVFTSFTTLFALPVLRLNFFSVRIFRTLKALLK